MGIEKQTQYYITCDICEDYFESWGGDRQTAIEVFRENGWKIGKKCTCPDCSSNLNKTNLEGKDGKL